ncbi:MAG TPA: MFS transporter, partial [Opitutus sp.]|nr:MFS transporter [Opitutus sp.]
MESSASSGRPSNVTAPADKVPVPQKIVYGLGTCHDMWGHWLYPNVGWQVFNIFLGVAPWLIGVALFLNRLFDALSDAIFGWLSDNTRTRWGRRRPYILVAGVLAGLGLPLLVAVAPGWGSTMVFGTEVPHYFWFMVISSAVYLPIMSAFKMPFDCLGYEMTPDYHERTSVWSFRNAVQKLPELGLFFAAQFMTMSVWVGASGSDWFDRVTLLFTDGNAWKPAAEGTRPNMLLAAQVYTVVLGLIMAAAAVVMFSVLRERYYGKVTERKQAK